MSSAGKDVAKPKIGLVLTGGGAHAAYQAGVLRGIAEIVGSKLSPFSIVTGVSGGAVNGAALAAGSDDLQVATENIWNVWKKIRAEDVFKTDTLSLLKIGARWLKDLGLGEFLGSSKSNYLLDNSPLRNLLGQIDYSSIKRHIASGILHGVGVTTTNYGTGRAVTFFDGETSIIPWSRGMRISVRKPLDLVHVMASVAIPVLFPPVQIEGCDFGDGCIRQNTPLSPAIHLGSDRIVVIGIQHPRSEIDCPPVQEVPSRPVMMVDIAGVLLNAVFMDSVELDLKRMQRVNRTVALLTPEQRAQNPDELRYIPVLAIQPSKNLSTLASEQFGRFPLILRHLLRGLGASNEKGWPLLSYLAFDGSYTCQLLELGYQDALAQREALRGFFE
ncbi:patatin-like phospholipase family protein [Bdellovibrionota bacterium FG-2]